MKQERCKTPSNKALRLMLTNSTIYHNTFNISLCKLHNDTCFQETPFGSKIPVCLTYTYVEKSNGYTLIR